MGVEMTTNPPAEYELAGALKEIIRLRDDLAKAQADRDEWKRRYDTACAHVEVDCEEAAKEAVAEMKPQLEKAKADVAALSKDVMPRSEFADLLEERDSLREWRDHCYAAWKERDALKADAAKARKRLVPLPDMNSSTTEPAVSSKDLTVPLEDAEALAKALEQLAARARYHVDSQPARIALRRWREQHPAPVSQACDAH